MEPTRTLLLVEGHSGVRTGLALRLRRLCPDLTVLTASSLTGALEVLSADHEVVVLCDPKSLAAEAEGDPAAVITTLHEQGCPLIVLTTTFDPDEASAWQQRGAQAVLLKGIALRVLVHCIGAACLQRQREQQRAERHTVPPVA